MKKYLLVGASAIALSVGASAAARADGASAPALSVHGTWLEWVGYGSTGAAAKNAISAGATVSSFWQGDLSALSFGATEKLDNGLTVAGTINLATNKGPLTPPNTTAGANPLVSNTFITINGGFGTVELGLDTNVMANNLVDGAAALPGGIIGHAPLIGVYVPTLGTAGKYDTAFTDQGSSYGVRYTTPTFSGFSAAVDYMPIGGADGGISQTQNTAGAGYGGLTAGQGSEFDGIFAYHNKLGDVQVDAEAGAGSEQASLAGGVKFNITGYQGGLKIGMNGFTIAAAAADRVASAGVANANKIAAHTGITWDASIGYGTGPWSVGAMYISSPGPDAAAGALNQNDSSHKMAIAAGYNLGPGVQATLTVYDEYDKLNTGVAGTTLSSTETGVIFGTSVNF